MFHDPGTFFLFLFFLSIGGFDSVVVVVAALDRTTDSKGNFHDYVSLPDAETVVFSPSSSHFRKGLIRDRAWFGEGGMEHVRTVKEPKQSIPTFIETVELLMKVSCLSSSPSPSSSSLFH